MECVERGRAVGGEGHVSASRPADVEKDGSARGLRNDFRSAMKGCK